MQSQQFAYDELTPLEQCIADFMATQQRRSAQTRKKQEVAKASKQN